MSPLDPVRVDAPPADRPAANPMPPRSRLNTRDLFSEAIAGLTQRPGRTALTALGTVLGVAAFVAVMGLTGTASNQISKRFTQLSATEVTVLDTGGAESAADPSAALLPDSFPADADARVRRINGVRDAGVWWVVDDQGKLRVTGVPLPGATDPGAVSVTAASAGLLRAVHPTLLEGRLYDEFLDQRAERVVVLGRAAADALGVRMLTGQPAIFVNDIPFTVVGILDDTARLPNLLFSVIIPRQTAEDLLGPPGAGHRAQMLVDTRVGAATVVAAQTAIALRPEAPELFQVTPPPDPRELRDQVSSDLWVLFLVLAGVCLVIGAVGIANTSMVAVLERVTEIGLRRAVGARPRHIAAQFLVESAVSGTAGGLVGTSLGVIVVVIVAAAQHWTTVLQPVAVLPAPLIGTVVGVVAGLYPALRAARIEPIEALRR